MRAECKLCHENIDIKERGLCADCSVYSDEQIQKSDLLNEIRDMEQNVLYRKEAFLRKYGWEHSCNFPGSYWLWVKCVRGETIAVSLNSAINIESNICHYKN